MPAGAVDVTQAQVAKGVAPVGGTSGLTVQVTQRSGHQSGVMNVLGTYDLGVVDSQGQAVQGLHARTPVTIVYHYQPKELVGLGINSDRVVLTYPALLAAANKAKASTKGLVIPMTNDAKNHTLTAHTTVLSATPFALGSIPQVQQPPKPHLASVADNTGNLTYTYPLQLPPGPNGFTPQIAFNYSSASPNNRHSPLSPADTMGDGWSLGMGSISAENYPDSSASGAMTWYFISGVDGVSDRLAADSQAGFFQTEHISHLRVLGTDINSNGDTPTCFHVWDKSGTYYEFGCTPDSVQSWSDSNGQHKYRWDLNLMVAPREGPNSPSKQIKVSYFQDNSNDATGYDSVRDAVIAQIVYQTVNPSANPTTTVVGTVDFSYRAPAIPSVPSGASSSWITQYGTNYNCQTPSGQPTTPPGNTTLRCDNPIDISSDTKAPAVMSVFSLQQITSYVGADSANHPAYKYTFNYNDTPFTQITDPITQNTEYAAGEHLLTNITPVQYLGGTAYPLKQIAFNYTQETNSYYDGTQTASDGTTQFQVQTKWQYLSYYVDQNTNIGENITYQTAYSNTNGTPYVTDNNGVITDDRHDPFYCTTHANDSDTSKRCTGNFAHPDERTWSVQVVTVRSALGKDSSASSLQPATYNYSYTLGADGNNQQDFGGNGTFCTPAGSSPPPGEDDCVFDTYIPGNGGADQDWSDYYHGEFRGFRKVYTTPPDGTLTVHTYYTPAAWGSSATLATNYQSGQMTKEDSYWGTQEEDGNLIKETVNHYSGSADFLPNGSSADSTACNTNLSATYTPCEIVLIFTKTTDYESSGTGTSNAPWVQTNYTYDDYDTGSGLNTSGSVYHNKTQEQTTSSNAPTVTKKWSYATNNSVDGNNNNYVYYTVDKVSHSEVDDAGGHAWQCQDTSYDEGVSGISQPAAGWPTTVKAYSDCGNQSNTAITSYTGYDNFGNPVARVDAFGASHSSTYGGNGCTLATAPAVLSGNWTQGRYTACKVYDAYAAQETSEQNALTQNISVSYDDNQGRLPTDSTDIMGQTTHYSYSVDSNGNQTLRVKKPGEPGTYTTQSVTHSTCTFGSNRPRYEIDNSSSLYAGAIKRTFYDAQGREVELRTPLDSAHDIVAFTVNNEWNHSQFKSEPFRVASGSSWIDPNSATDETGNAPVGTLTINDPLGRVRAVQDPAAGSAAEPGITCPNLSGSYTSCSGHGLGSPYGDSHLYSYTITHDANNHMAVSFADALGRDRYSQAYRVSGSVGSNITTKKETQYNALDKPTAVIVTDMAPQSGQSITSVNTTASYDDLGRVISLADPDRGNHTYSYDADNRPVSDVSSSRTVGISYDLLGRLRCIQDAAPTTDGSGSCSNGSHPLVQNTYGISYLQLSGTTDYVTGQLTQSVATTYYPDGISVTTTHQFEHDQRGRLIATNLHLSVPASWNVTTALPTYMETLAYNNDDQPTTTQTTVGGQPGYTFTQAYDSTTGMLTGLSNNTVGVANLATQSYDLHGVVSDINFLASSGSNLVNLANDHFTYDGNLRPASSTAIWQSGSGSTGTIFSTNRVYDPVGNVISTSTTHAAVPGQSNSGGSETQNFCYDEQNRLVWAGNTGTTPGAGNGTCGSATLSSGLNGAAYNASYVYTHLDQQWQGPLNGSGAAQQYLYCDNTHPHHLTGLYPVGTTCASLSGAVYGTGYDSWGNLTSRTYNGKTAALSYDVLDHLIRWDWDAANQDRDQEWYAYDITGQRTLNRSVSSSGTTLTVYAFGLEEHAYSGSGANTGNTYYYTLDKRLIGKSDGTNTQFYLTDALGSVLSSFRAVAGTATVLANQVYGPYGNQRYSKGTIGTNKGFTGQYTDATGLDYYNARYYDPAVGRFLSTDTVQGNIQGTDPYAYVKENPETENDPTGRCPQCLAFATEAGLLGIELGPADLLVIGGAWLLAYAATHIKFQQTYTPSNGGINSSSITKAITTDINGTRVIVGGEGGQGGISAWEQESLAEQGAAANAASRATLVKSIQALYNARRINREEMKKRLDVNFAVGFLQKNNQWPPQEYGPILGSGGQAGHSEQKIIDYWTNSNIPLLDLKPGDFLNLLIVTRNQMCGECQGQLDTWQKQLATAAGPGVTIHLYLWEQMDVNDTPTWSNLRQVSFS